MRRWLFLVALAWSAGPIAAEVTLDEVVSERGLDGFVTVERLPVPEVPGLIEGRRVWEGTCMACHGGNKATGAPKITSTRKWEPRIAQGLPTLVQHATEGFLGKTYAQMPARGGNADLSDAEVASAVAFMVWASGGADVALDFVTTPEE